MNIENITNIIANFVIPDHQNNHDHRELVAYGVGAILTSLITMGLAIIIHIFVNRHIELLLILLFFLPLRLIHKGYHCSTFIRCLITTNLLLYGITFLSVNLGMSRNLMIALFIILLLIQMTLSYEHNVKVFLIYLFLFFLNIVFNIHLEMFMLAGLTTNLILIMGRRIKDDISYKRIST